MWFLWFYLISIAICMMVLLLISKASANRLKREFPELKIKKKKSFIELICAFLPFMIPFINLVILLFCILQQEKVIQETIEKVRKEQQELENE